MNLQTEQADPTEKKFSAAPLWRRLLAVFYDTIMLACLVFIAWQPVPLLPDDNWPGILSKGLRLGYLLFITFLFFGWFWTHGGQTIGMRAWKIKLINSRQSATSAVNPTWFQAWMRYCIALLSWSAFGCGFIWSLFDKYRRTWHDLGSSTSLIVVR